MNFFKIFSFFALIFLSSGAQAFDCNSRIAVAPPKVSDPELGRKIVAEFVKQWRKDLNLTCQPFLDFEATVQIFDMIGYSSFFTIDPSKITRKSIGIVFEEANATHILFIASQKNSETLFDGSLYEIVNESKLSLDQELTLSFDPRFIKTNSNPWALRYLALFTPNNISTGITSTQVSFNVDERYKEESTKLKGYIPPLVSSVSFTKIDHRKGYRLFDYNGTIFPSSFLFAIDQDTTIRKKPDVSDSIPDERTLHVEVFGACTNLNAEGSLFLPIGTFFLSLGWGPCLMERKQESSNKTFYLTGASKTTLGYMIFLTDKVNAFIQFDLLVFSKPIYRTEYAKSSDIVRASIGLGWYIPDVESRFLRNWKSIF